MSTTFLPRAGASFLVRYARGPTTGSVIPVLSGVVG